MENLFDMKIVAQFQKLIDVRPCKVNVCKWRTYGAPPYLLVNTTSGSKNDDHGLLKVLNQLLLFSVLGINLVYRKEQAIIGGTNVLFPFQTTLVNRTIHMTRPSGSCGPYWFLTSGWTLVCSFSESLLVPHMWECIVSKTRKEVCTLNLVYAEIRYPTY